MRSLLSPSYSPSRSLLLSPLLIHLPVIYFLHILFISSSVHSFLLVFISHIPSSILPFRRFLSRFRFRPLPHLHPLSRTLYSLSQLSEFLFLWLICLSANFTIHNALAQPIHSFIHFIPFIHILIPITRLRNFPHICILCIVLC